MTIAELITIFRKEAEDMIQANIRSIYKAKYGINELEVGDNTITFPVNTDEAANYVEGEEYAVKLIEAIDMDGIDVKDALVISLETPTGFVITSSRIATVKWDSFLIVPNFNFWT